MILQFLSLKQVLLIYSWVIGEKKKPFLKAHNNQKASSTPFYQHHLASQRTQAILLFTHSNSSKCVLLRLELCQWWKEGSGGKKLLSWYVLLGRSALSYFKIWNKVSFCTNDLVCISLTPLSLTMITAIWTENCLINCGGN